MRRFTYETCCINSDGPSITAMVDEAREVTLATFRRHCDTTEWERGMSYSVGSEPGLHLKDDYHVSYYKGRYKGRRCYFAVHSAIEHIFTN